MGLVDSIIIDIDDATPLDVTKVWFNLCHLGADGIRGRISSGGKGVHIEATIPWSEWPHYRVREIIGDDKYRIGKDREKPWRPKNVAFDRKGDQSVSRWYVELDRLLCKFID